MGILTSKVGLVQAYRSIKLVTFTNEAAGAVPLFTVTGDVEVNVTAIGKTTLTSAAAANISLGVTGVTAGMIAATVATLLAANEIWNDTSPTSVIEPISARRDYTISNGSNIILTLDAQVDTGAIAVYCLWKQLSTNGNVIAA